MTLLGLVRHLTEIERNYLAVWAGITELPDEGPHAAALARRGGKPSRELVAPSHAVDLATPPMTLNPVRPAQGHGPTRAVFAPRAPSAEAPTPPRARAPRHV